MTFNEIRRMAKGMGVNTYRMKKTDLVRGIQQAESAIECYGTERVDFCNEHECLWRKDCLCLNSNKKIDIPWH
jgi:hypothetical protein